MFQPTPDPRTEPVQIPADRETVIKFVISGPFLNAEARAQSEQGATEHDLQALLGRIAELELELRDERARVDSLCRALTAGSPRAAAAAPAPAEEPAPDPEPRPKHELAPEPERLPEPVAAMPAFTMSAVDAPLAPAAPTPPAATPLSVAPIVERARAHTLYDASAPAAPPKLHALSTVAAPSPPKVRGLRRMIGALRHL